MSDARPPLATGYYLDNFELLLGETARAYGDFLAAAERRFVDEFLALPLDARRLYVRLLERRGPWFRRDRLRYREVDCALGAEALLGAGFASLAPAGAGEERLASLSLRELRDLLDEPAARIDGVFRRAPAGAERRELERCLMAAIDAAELARRVPLLRLEWLDTVRLMRLLYFGNLRQDLREFVRRDLGLLRFEPVAISGRSFPSRSAADEHLRLHDLLERLLAASPPDRDAALDSEIGVATLACAHEVNRPLRDAALRLLARSRERAGQLDQALALYEATRLPPARERRVRILGRLGRRDEADALRATMRAAPLDEGERLFATRGPRGRKTTALPERHLRLDTGLAGESVETRSLAALSAAGHRGFFAQNWLWRSLFGLAFWEIVFAPVDGAFVHRYQYGPRDLYDGFRAARQRVVEERLAALAADPRPGAELLALWDRKFGVANRLVSFAPAVRPHLELALSVLDGARLALVCDRLSRDLRRYGSGFPDLFLVDPRGEILLAEVKGRGDGLRPDQEGWLTALNQAGLHAVVLHVGDGA